MAIYCNDDGRYSVLTMLQLRMYINEDKLLPLYADEVCISSIS